MAKVVDLSYLTGDEKSEYRRARRVPASAYGAGLGMAALCSVPVGGLIWVAVTSADGGWEEWANLVWIAVWVVGLFGLLASIGPLAKGATDSENANVDAFLWKIKYHDRVRSGRRPGTADVTSAYAEDVKSTRQVQHEWYGDHSELDWRDRERAQMYGMDVETYISNVLENDKD